MTRPDPYAQELADLNLAYPLTDSLTVRQIAQLTQCSEPMVRQHIDSGRLRSYRVTGTARDGHETQGAIRVTKRDFITWRETVLRSAA